MKKALLLSITLLFFSSYRTTKSTEQNLETLYLMSMDADYQIIQITDNINDKLYNHKELITEQFIEYDSLTNRYVKVIDKILDDITPSENDFKPSVVGSSEVSNAYFFEGEKDYTKKAQEFLNSTDAYREAVTALSDNYFTTSRLRLVLNTKPIILYEGKKMDHLNYYLKDVTLLGAIVYLKKP